MPRRICRTAPDGHPVSNCAGQDAFLMSLRTLRSSHDRIPIGRMPSWRALIAKEIGMGGTITGPFAAIYFLYLAPRRTRSGRRAKLPRSVPETQFRSL